MSDESSNPKPSTVELDYKEAFSEEGYIIVPREGDGERIYLFARFDRIEDKNGDIFWEG